MYHPTGRVLTVLELLQSRPGLTGRELADRLETDIRTVRRYIVKLQDVGIPVEGSPGRLGGYRLRPGYKLPPLIFTHEEATAMVLGLLGSPWLEVEQPRTAVEGALSKITRVLPADARLRVEAISTVAVLSPHREEERPQAALLLGLGEAVHTHACVRIAYRSETGEATERVVEPYGLVGRKGRWYLVGWCRLRKDYRTFRLDRLRVTEHMEEAFSPDESFDYRAFAIQQLDNYPARWRVEVSFTAGLPAVRRRVPSSFGELTPEDDGVRFTWRIDDLDYAARYLMATELGFRVREPPELRDALRRLAAEAARAAEDPPPAGHPPRRAGRRGRARGGG
jgi:predicted DNA-binding transcriptional regulator YafY